MAYQVQIDGEIRDATKAETALIDTIKKDAEIKAKADADRAKLKADTLAKLGLTADEVAALLS
jgi:hypothetical protein